MPLRHTQFVMFLRSRCGGFTASLAIIFFALFSSCSSGPKSLNQIEVKLRSAEKSNSSGVLTFSQMGGILVIRGKVTGLTPGLHGFHAHENADCGDFADGFKKAGGHYNPKKSKHGSLVSGHMGDLGNISVNENGVAEVYLEVEKFNILEKSPSSILGRSVMIHANADDERTDPAGNSGARILCGIIK